MDPPYGGSMVWFLLTFPTWETFWTTSVILTSRIPGRRSTPRRTVSHKSVDPTTSLGERKRHLWLGAVVHADFGRWSRRLNLLSPLLGLEQTSKHNVSQSCGPDSQLWVGNNAKLSYSWLGTDWCHVFVSSHWVMARRGQTQVLSTPYLSNDAVAASQPGKMLMFYVPRYIWLIAMDRTRYVGPWSGWVFVQMEGGMTATPFAFNKTVVLYCCSCFICVYQSKISG